MASTVDDLYDLLPLLAAECPGVPTGLRRQALRIAGRQFLRDTEAWRETSTNAGAPTGYTGNPQVLKVLRVTVAGEEISLGAFRYSQVDGLTVDGGGTATTLCVFLPARESSEYPQFILEQYGEGIAAAALAWLKSQLNKPWSDPAGAAVQMALSAAVVAKAKGRIARVATVAQ